jgi:hypothetical protein
MVVQLVHVLVVDGMQHRARVLIQDCG